MSATRIVASVAAALCLSPFVGAYKDDSYYMAGSGNPNVNQKMYWKDADNVLQDLSKFKALYVEFSHCAWTWMQMEEADNDVDENDYWYMGKVPPMGANVAFSLYGSLKSDSSFSGCNGDTFINSFYTNTGFQDYAKAMYKAGQSGFSSYAYDDDDDGSSNYLTASCGGGYGVGCDATYGFAMHTYSTDTCDPKYANGVTDSLSSLNSALKSTSCVKIYDSNSYNSNYVSGTALELLYYSSACFYQNYYSPDGECPDPYGKIAMYRQNFAKGLQRQRKSQPYVIYTDEVRKGKTMVAIGSLLLSAALVVIFMEVKATRKFKKGRKNLAEDRTDGLVKPEKRGVVGAGTVGAAAVAGSAVAGKSAVGEKSGGGGRGDAASTTTNKEVAEDSSYKMLENMKQSANREMAYRMAIFNGNVERIRNSVTSAFSWDVELTSPKTTPADETQPQGSPVDEAAVASSPKAADKYPSGQHSSPFTQITPSPLPSQDEASLPMPSVNKSSAEETNAVNISLLTEATALASAVAPPSTSEPHQDMYDEVLRSREDKVDQAIPEPSVEQTASAHYQQSSGVQQRFDDYYADVGLARSGDSAGDISNASSTTMDKLLAAKMENALLDETRPSMDVILQNSSGQSSKSAKDNDQQDTEAVLVEHEDVPASSSYCCN